MKYDAFISYRHGELDGLVAEKLHKMLETYRIPAEIAKRTGKKRINRIFRDREELPTSSNLSGSINDALENSEFLLLICSPRLLESKWCMREVEIFGQLHGKDKIITLLIDGEPEDAFPPDIRFRVIDGQTVEVEPLAADIRARTGKECLKLLKSEKLRLLAPLLSCGYDDLKQRHRARRRKIMATIIGSVLAGSLCFGGFSTYQYLQIQKQMQLKLENQSYVLSGYSGQVFANGHPQLAMLLALEALPQSLGKPSRPYVKAAEMALANALGVYDMSAGFKPYKTVTLPAAPGGMVLSPAERYGAVNYTFELSIFDLEAGRAVATLPTIESSLAEAEFLTDDIIVFSGEDGLTAYDITNSHVLWTGEKATGIAISHDRARIAAVCRDEGKALIYTAEGENIGEISFGGRHCPVPSNDTFLNPCDFVFSLNEDGSKLAVSFDDGSLSLFHGDNLLQEISLYPTSNAIHFSGGFSGDFFSFALVENNPYVARYMVYDAKTELFTLELASQTSKFVTDAGEHGLYFANENQIYGVNGATGEMTHMVSMGERTETIRKNEANFLICDSVGGYHFIGQEIKSYLSDTVCNFIAMGETFALTGSYDSETVRILKKQESRGTDVLAYDPSYAFSEARVDRQEGFALLYSYKGLSRFTLNGVSLGEISFPYPEQVVDTQYDRSSGNLAVLYEDLLLVYSGRTGNLIMEMPGIKGRKSVVFTSYGVHIIQENGLVSLVDLATALVIREGRIPVQASFAVWAGKPLYGIDGRVFFDGKEIGEGVFIGGAYYGGDEYSFAIAGNETGKVFTVGSKGLKEVFSFNLRGKSEAFFTGDYVFIAELRGRTMAYHMDGTVARAFSEDGYVAETEFLGDAILMHLVSTSSGRYSLLLDGKTLEVAAYLPRLMDWQGEGSLIFDDGNGHLRAGFLYDAQELVDAAQEALNGRVLTDEERLKYRTE